MKTNVLRTLGIITLFTAFFASTTAFSAKKVEHSNSDNSCIVYITTSYGSAAKSVKVSTDVSGGISCVGGRSFYTNSDGKVTLEWSSGCYLKKIFVDGRGYEVDYKDGNTYNLTMK